MRLARRMCALGVLAACGVSVVPRPAAALAAPPPIRHVFTIVLENESASTTFGPGSPAPYLSKTLRAQGAYLPNYYGIGHFSNDNYIAMISGQAPNPQNQSDCQVFGDFTPATIGAFGQVLGTGCVYPAAVQTIAGQMSAKGLTWRDYNDGMGADPTREASECAHPGIGMPDNTEKATAADQYATRHNPFVYFHSIINDTTLCDTHVVNLALLPRDLASASDTPNYVFITPDLCNDGHDATCANGGPGGLGQADTFLREWVPRITGSPAFRQQNGLLIIIFDEAETSDSSSCCGEIPGPSSSEPGISGPGGGDVGAVLLSPCIAPGTVTSVAYNHYTMLRSVEDIFKLSHLGYAGLPGGSSFGSGVFTRSCTLSPPVARMSAPAIASSVAIGPQIPVRWSATDTHGPGVANFTLQVRSTSSPTSGWRTLLRATKRRSLTFRGAVAQTYQFRVQAVDQVGRMSLWATASTVTPTGVHPAGGSYSGAWNVHAVRGAWEGHAVLDSAPGASFSLRYVGGALAIIGDRGPQGGRARVTLDGHSRTIDLRSASRHPRQVLYSARVRPGTHRLTIVVLSGVVALEGLAISSRHG